MGSVGPDLVDRQGVRDPASYFLPFRDRPVWWSDAQRGWVVLDHAEVSTAFRDAHALSADRISSLERVAATRPAAFARVVDLLRGWMIFRDPPAHTRLREPVRNAFTPRVVQGLEPAITAVVHQAVDELVASGGDFTETVAKPVPAMVIAALLGVDHDDRRRFQAWSDDLAAIVFSTSPALVPDGRVTAAAEQFHAFFGALVEQRRAEPGDDLVSKVLDIEAHGFSAAELVGMCTLLLFAGHETTTGLLQALVATLLEHPDLEAALRADRSLVPGAVEEVLRRDGPARTMVRKAAVDHERGGHHLRRGDTVYLAIAAANHDPTVFARPEALDITRDPNPHLGFGWGLHHCLGATLARIEGRLVVEALLDAVPAVRAAGPIPHRVGSVIGLARGPIRLQV